jgi:hypothetical protein
VNAALLRRAAAEFFVEGFEYAEKQREIESTDAEDRLMAIEALRPRRSVPEGCFAWINHLIWLERMLEIVPLGLTAEEAEGLLVLKRERTHFQAEHPPCPSCGMPNEPYALNCRECMAAIKR